MCIRDGGNTGRILPERAGRARDHGSPQGLRREPARSLQDRPADLSTVIEITASDEYLFLLHQDSRMTVCQFRTGMTKTRCDDPLPYHMVMTGQTDAEVTVPPAQFTQLQITQPPEPSLYILDVSGAAVYHFSHKLNMKQQFRADPQDPWLPEDTVSAFVVTPGRRIILAYANRLYFATLP